jgi:hypothetical protein
MGLILNYGTGVLNLAGSAILVRPFAVLGAQSKHLDTMGCKPSRARSGAE